MLHNLNCVDGWDQDQLADLSTPDTFFSSFPYFEGNVTSNCKIAKNRINKVFVRYFGFKGNRDKIDVNVLDNCHVSTATLPEQNRLKSRGKHYHRRNITGHHSLSLF